MNIDVEIAVFGDNISEEAATTIMNEVFRGMGEEIHAQRHVLHAACEGNSSYTHVWTLSGQQFMTVKIDIDRTVAPEFSVELARRGLKRVVAEISYVLGKTLTESTLEAVNTFISSLGTRLNETLNTTVNGILRRFSS